MLTRTLALSVIWLFLSAIVTLLRGTHLKRGNAILSLTWLVWVILAGDLWALLTFAIPGEVLIASILVFLFGTFWIIRLPDWNGLGQVTWTMGIGATILYLAYSFAVTAFSPLSPLGLLLSLILFSLEFFTLGLSLSFAFETLDACTRFRWRNIHLPAQPVKGFTPKVSLHIPTYNEPVKVVEETLRSLARLDYPNFEVLLIDNNTPEEAKWRPLEAVCRELGPNFKILHLDKWPGYKSGALNFGLSLTAPDAEIIGVIDADYTVEPGYLRETVPYFVDPTVAFLQTPQDYRSFSGNVFLEACYDAYKYFFEVAMPVRNERNAIIFGGTMGLIRKSVLQKIGGWDEWCITEDAEASLRILKLGYRSIYINRTYGRGIMPLNFEDLKKQRFRWCFGGIQIIRKHLEALIPWAHWLDPGNKLTSAQRYFYLMAGLQWFNELATMSFTLLLLLGGTALVFGLGIGVRPLTGFMAVVPVVFLVLGLWRFGWALRNRLKLSVKKSLLAMSSFFSLSWVVALASIQGLIQSRGIFLRTPKIKSPSSLSRALRATQWETGIGSLCAFIGVSLSLSHPPFTGWIVVIFLVWQSSFYLAAPVFSLLSEQGRRVVPMPSPGEILGREVKESRAAVWVFSILAGLALVAAFIRILPQPTGTTNLTGLQPGELQPQQILGIPPLPTATPQPGLFFNPTATSTTATGLISTPTPTSPRSTQAPTQKPMPTQAPTQKPNPTQSGGISTPTQRSVPTPRN